MQMTREIALLILKFSFSNHYLLNCCAVLGSPKLEVALFEWNKKGVAYANLEYLLVKF